MAMSRAQRSGTQTSLRNLRCFALHRVRDTRSAARQFETHPGMSDIIMRARADPEGALQER